MQTCRIPTAERPWTPIHLKSGQEPIHEVGREHSSGQFSSHLGMAFLCCSQSARVPLRPAHQHAREQSEARGCGIPLVPRTRLLPHEPPLRKCLIRKWLADGFTGGDRVQRHEQRYLSSQRGRMCLPVTGQKGQVQKQARQIHNARCTNKRRPACMSTGAKKPCGRRPANAEVEPPCHILLCSEKRR